MPQLGKISHNRNTDSRRNLAQRPTYKDPRPTEIVPREDKGENPLKWSLRTVVLLRWRFGSSNLDVVRVFQRWNSGWQSAGFGHGASAGPICHDRHPRPRGYSRTQARTWTSWTGARGCARIHVARCPGYTTCDYGSAFLGSSCATLKDASWCPTLAGPTIVSISSPLSMLANTLEIYIYIYFLITLCLLFTIAVHVEESMDWRDPSFLEALEAETCILQKRVHACKSHVLLITCFDSCPRQSYSRQAETSTGIRIT